MFLTKEDEERFNSWTKEQIYEAYIAEAEARKLLAEQLNKLQERLAAVRYIARSE